MLLISSLNCRQVVDAGVSVAVISSLERVLQDDIDVNGTQTAEIYCAKNEYESFQIIIINPTDTPIPQIYLNVDSWHFTGIPGKASPELTLYREHYVNIKLSSGNSNRPKGMYPDALIPFVNPYTSQRITSAKYLASGVNVKPLRSQAYWVDVNVGKNVAAGNYTNQITVFSMGKVIATIPINLVVWDFTLPEEHKLTTYFGKLRDVSGYHNMTIKSAKYKQIKLRYLRALYAHGIDQVYLKYPGHSGATGVSRFTDKYIADLREFSNEFKPKMYKVPSWYDTNQNLHKQLKAHLNSYSEFIAANPWVGEPFSYIDEPDLKTFKIIDYYGKALKQYAPEIKMLVTTPIKPNVPGAPSLEGIVNRWVILWRRGNLADIKRRQALGDVIWSYTALTQSDKTPSWEIDFPLLDYRIPVWFSWSLDLKGLLYWQTVAWANKDKPIDPWVNPVTWAPHSWNQWNGEGSLLYPGTDAGVEGPVVSMRLKVLRDAIEDYDYFWILSNLQKKDEADQIVKKVASSFRVYSKDPLAYIEARKQIAEKILQTKL